MVVDLWGPVAVTVNAYVPVATLIFPAIIPFVVMERPAGSVVTVQLLTSFSTVGSSNTFCPRFSEVEPRYNRLRGGISVQPSVFRLPKKPPVQTRVAVPS